jgi:hypothetical protein
LNATTRSDTFHLKLALGYKWGRKVWRAAIDDFARETGRTSEGTVDRAALVNKILAEVQSARGRLNEARKGAEAIELKGRVIDGIVNLGDYRKRVDKRKILLERIEQAIAARATGSSIVKYGTDRVESGDSKKGHLGF